ncbi:hypothetical protein L195_g042146, partial [Trifolium pratense]
SEDSDGGGGSVCSGGDDCDCGEGSVHGKKKKKPFKIGGIALQQQQKQR